MIDMRHGANIYQVQARNLLTTIMTFSSHFTRCTVYDMVIIELEVLDEIAEHYSRILKKVSNT